MTKKTIEVTGDGLDLTVEIEGDGERVEYVYEEMESRLVAGIGTELLKAATSNESR